MRIQSPSHSHSPKPTQRSGTAAVELAIVAPVLFAIVFGAIDFGRAMMVANLLTTVSREAARLATLPNTTYQSVSDQIDTQLTADSLTKTGVTKTVQVNGSTVTDLSSTKPGDSISVSVTLPFDNVSWLPMSWFLKGKTVGGSAVMVKQ